MQAKALKKYIRSSPRKMRLVIDLIRGKNAEEALDILSFTKNTASKVAYDVLKSAVSNLNYKADQEGLSYESNEILVKTVFVNQGPTMKRIQPAPMGRAFRIRKRTNHLTIELETKDHNDQVVEEEITENNEE